MRIPRADRPSSDCLGWGRMAGCSSVQPALFSLLAFPFFLSLKFCWRSGFQCVFEDSEGSDWLGNITEQANDKHRNTSSQHNNGPWVPTQCKTRMEVLGSTGAQCLLYSMDLHIG